MTSTYQKYLVADLLEKRMRAVGAIPGNIYFMQDDSVHVGLAYEWRKGGAYDSAESREQIVADFLAAYPDAELDRAEKDYSGRPQMTVRGTMSPGIPWQIDFREGVCERVQVGTKTVEKPAPGAPTVAVEEPVFEYRCPDPLREAVAA